MKFTEKEKEFIQAMINNYNDLMFADTDFKLNWSLNTIKGVMTSLIKKDIIWAAADDFEVHFMFEINGEETPEWIKEFTSMFG